MDEPTPLPSPLPLRAGSDAIDVDGLTKPDPARTAVTAVDARWSEGEEGMERVLSRRVVQAFFCLSKWRADSWSARVR